MKKLFIVLICCVIYSVAYCYGMNFYFDEYTAPIEEWGDRCEHEAYHWTSTWYVHSNGEHINDHLQDIGMDEMGISDYSTNGSTAEACYGDLARLKNWLWNQYKIPSWIEWKKVRTGYYTGALHINDFYIKEIGNTEGDSKRRNFYKYYRYKLIKVPYRCLLKGDRYWEKYNQTPEMPIYYKGTNDLLGVTNNTYVYVRENELKQPVR